MKKDRLMLVGLNSEKRGAVIADRSPIVFTFTRGDTWFRGTVSIDDLFTTLLNAGLIRADEHEEVKPRST